MLLTFCESCLLSEAVLPEKSEMKKEIITKQHTCTCAQPQPRPHAEHPSCRTPLMYNTPHVEHPSAEHPSCRTPLMYNTPHVEHPSVEHPSFPPPLEPSPINLTQKSHGNMKQGKTSKKCRKTVNRR